MLIKKAKNLSLSHNVLLDIHSYLKLIDILTILWCRQVWNFKLWSCQIQDKSRRQRMMKSRMFYLASLFVCKLEKKGWVFQIWMNQHSDTHPYQQLILPDFNHLRGVYFSTGLKNSPLLLKTFPKFLLSQRRKS